MFSLSGFGASGSCGCCEGGGSSCFPCTIPPNNLAVCLHNVIRPDESVSLVYTAPNLWKSACHRGLIFTVTCTGGITSFIVTYFISGSCPDGQSQTCTLARTSATCDPYYLTHAITYANCPFLSLAGYDGADVYDPATSNPCDA